jgi:hypothetical protein
MLLNNDPSVSVALLDVRLGNESAAPVARELTRRGTPFLFYTGQVGVDGMLDEWPKSKIIPKPAQPNTIVAAITGLLGGHGSAPRPVDAKLSA